MTPMNQMGNAGISGGGSSNLYNNIASKGLPPDNSSTTSPEETSEQPQQQSPADNFIQQLGVVFIPFQKFMGSYPQASNQAEDVNKAIANWVSAVNAGLSQQGGGESSPL